VYRLERWLRPGRDLVGLGGSGVGDEDKITGDVKAHRLAGFVAGRASGVGQRHPPVLRARSVQPAIVAGDHGSHRLPVLVAVFVRRAAKVERVRGQIVAKSFHFMETVGMRKGLHRGKIPLGIPVRVKSLAGEIAQAFGLGGQVQPKMWVVVYRGNVIPTESGTFRFAGVCDDILVVRFNGRVVLDSGSMTPSGHGPQKFYAGDGLKLENRKGMEWYKGSGRGEPFQVTGGQSYPMEVMIGEWPGGDFKAWLLIEKEGVEYEKDSKGVPILPIFKLAASEVAHPGGEAPVFAKSGPIWKAEKPKDDTATAEKK